jgi:hypothetical protein
MAGAGRYGSGSVVAYVEIGPSKACEEIIFPDQPLCIDLPIVHRKPRVRRQRICCYRECTHCSERLSVVWRGSLYRSTNCFLEYGRNQMSTKSQSELRPSARVMFAEASIGRGVWNTRHFRLSSHLAIQALQVFL